MRSEVVPWRRVIAILAAVVAGLAAVVLVLRADGFTPVDASVSRATRWFVDGELVVLADGYSGRTLARIDVGDAGDVLEVAQSAAGVAVIDRSAATARAIDASALRLGPARSLGVVASPSSIVNVAQSGLVAVDPEDDRGLLLPPGGDAVPFAVDNADDRTLVAPDGSVWTLADGTLARATTTNQNVIASGLPGARFTLVGATPLVYDGERSRVRLGDGAWIALPDDVDPSEVVLQEPGPSSGCGWLGVNDELRCIGPDGIEVDVTIDGLGIGGADRLAIAGDAAVLVRRAPLEIVPIDWRSGTLRTDQAASVPAASQLDVAASTDIIWIDQTNGPFVWAANPWGIQVIQKDDVSAPILGDDGDVLDEGETGGDVVGAAGGSTTAEAPFEPDENGIDDPPIAIDDQVTARTGAPVPVVVTANDRDPDGEAIALFAVDAADHGTVEISTATTAVYRPDPGYVGVDQFGYTIVDGNGTPATATVTLQLLPADAANQAPIGTDDTAETGVDADVVIDVLLNDIDPERDPLRIDSFTPPDVGGRLVEVESASRLPALRYTPPPGASGTATFTYRPADVLGAVGDPVTVQVDIAQPTVGNRAPVVRPDAVRLRRNEPTPLAVLANDRDPDGDLMLLDVVRPLPPGLLVDIDGDRLLITARAGARDLSPFAYSVDDGHGNVVTGSVLVALIGDDEPNRPPVANADTASVVVGTSRQIDVLANDSDPDGDTLFLVAVRRDAGSAAGGELQIEGRQVRYTPAPVDADVDAAVDRFKYVISDGNGHEAEADVTVRVLAEPIAAPPYAQDDAASTLVDTPVTLDVLYNDGDPSGERPSIVGTPGCAGGGTARVGGDGRVTYTPPPGRSGVFTCGYRIVNSQGLPDEATIVITVREPERTNRPPDVGNLERTVEIGTSIEVDLLEAASDADGPEELRVLSMTAPVVGEAVRDGSVVTYRAPDQVGQATIRFSVGDGGSGVTQARLDLRIVEPDPLPPVAVDDQRTITGPAEPQTFDVLSNDIDPDGDRADLTVLQARVTLGQATASVVGRDVVVAAAPDYVGGVMVSYTIEDADGLTDDGNVTLTVLEAPNQQPVAQDDTDQVVNGGTVTVPIALNDVDPDGDPLTYSIVAPPDPALGSARLENQSLVFRATPGASGTASVTYQVTDDELTDEAVVRITVLPCSVARPEAPDVFLQTGYQQPIAIDLGAYARNGDIVQVGPPLSAPSGIIEPPPGENGNIVFTYAVQNSCRIQAVGQVVIDVNQEPAATSYEQSIGRREVLSIPVTSLATDAEPLTITALEQAPPWMTVAADGQSIDVAPAGAAGRADAVAVVADPGGLQVRVPVSIALINLAPVAQDDTIADATGGITFDPLANDSDPDGDPLSLFGVPATLAFPNGGTGTIEVVEGNRLRIDPVDGRGVSSFEYTVVDSLGLASEPATVTVRVNQPPVAPDVDIELPAGTDLLVAIPATDPDGDPLVLELLDTAAPLQLTVDGLSVTIDAPRGAAELVADVRYRVTDPLGATAEGILHITVLERARTTTTTTAPPTTTTVAP